MLCPLPLEKHSDFTFILVASVVSVECRQNDMSISPPQFEPRTGHPSRCQLRCQGNKVSLHPYDCIDRLWNERGCLVSTQNPMVSSLSQITH